MKVYCPECETACSAKAPICPKCGHPLKKTTVARRTRTNQELLAEQVALARPISPPAPVVIHRVSGWPRFLGLVALVAAMAVSLPMTVVFILVLLVGAIVVLNRIRGRKFATLYPTGRSSCLEEFPGIANVGEAGTCVGQLRPIGKVRFGNTLVDAIAEGTIIETGTKVEVIERLPNRIVVRVKCEGSR